MRLNGFGRLYEFFLEHCGPADIGTVMMAALEHGVDFGVEDVRWYPGMGWGGTVVSLRRETPGRIVQEVGSPEEDIAHTDDLSEGE